jgi:hypothetical protein
VTVVDTSVVVAAFASWHAQHEAADNAIDGGARLVAHCALEAFSVLTRLPPPFRATAPFVRDFLADRFPDANTAHSFPTLSSSASAEARRTMRWSR